MKKQLTFRFDWLLVFLILLPTFYVVGQDLRSSQMNFFQLGIISMLAFYCVNRWLGLFLGWSLFQLVFFKDIPSASIILQNMFFGILLYHFIVKYCHNLKNYYWVLMGLLALNIFWCVLQMNNIDPLFSMANPQYQTVMSEYSGFFSLPAFLGNYAAVVAPICLLVFPPTALLVIPAIIFSKSSFSILALLGGMLFYLWFRKRILFFVTLIVLGIGTTFYIVKYDAPSGQFNRRLIVWRLIIQESFQKHFFGHGIGSYNNTHSFLELEPSTNMAMVQSPQDYFLFLHHEAAIKGKGELLTYMKGLNPASHDGAALLRVARKNGISVHVWDNPHNEFLRIFFESGIIGLLIIIGFIGGMFRRFFKLKRKTYELAALMASFIAIVIVAFAHFPFYVARLGGVFIPLIAFLELKLIEGESA